MGLDEYVSMYMKPWDVADMSEAERAQQVRPSMATAIHALARASVGRVQTRRLVAMHQLQPSAPLV